MGRVVGQIGTADRWWNAGKDNAHGGVLQAAKAIAAQQSTARADDALYMRMYGPTDGIRGTTKARELASRNGLDGFRYNLIRSAVNTAVAHVGSQRTKPRFVTDDADWGIVKRAKACEQVLAGIFHAERYYEKATDVFRDCGITRVGSLFVYREDGRVRYERVLPGELLVDVREGYYGQPRTLYRLKAVERQVLQETYNVKNLPDSGAVDRELFNAFPWLTDAVQSTADQVMTVTAWRLPCGKQKGRRVVCVGGQTLDDREYKRKRFPFAVLRWTPQQTGFYGTPIAAELRGHQRAINYIDLKIADMMHKNSRSNLVVFNTPANKVNVKHIDNDPSTIIQVTGNQPPVQLTANAVPGEFFQHRQQIIADAFGQLGITELQATGQVDLGPNASGAAIREMSESGSRRWKDKLQAVDRFALDVALITMDELQEGAQAGDLAEIQVTSKRGALTRLQMVNWADNALEEHQYQIDCTPASALPDSTAGRTATVNDWYAAGFIDRQTAMQLLDFPDLQRHQSLDLAAYEAVLDAIEAIIEDGEYFAPEPTDDLDLALKLATQSYTKFRIRRAPPERLELLLQYLDDVQYLLEQAAIGAQQAQPAAAAPQLPAPAGAPAPAPTMQPGQAPMPALAAA
jgi:hypothetical protein